MSVRRIEQLPWSSIAHELVGAEHGLPVTILFVDAPPGRGPSLHRHPYAELFIVQEGEVTFTLGDAEVEARAGDVVVARPNEPHAFVNSGSLRLNRDIPAGSALKRRDIEELFEYPAELKLVRISGEFGRDIATAKQAREICKIGVFYDTVEETLAAAGFAPNRNGGTQGFLRKTQ